MKRSTLMLVLGLVFGGCQSTQSIEKHSVIDNASFMTLWDTFAQCRTGVDLDAMRTASRQLNQVAHRPGQSPASDIPLPKAIQRLVAEPPSRLAVDPKAMAAACNLYTGQAALTAGRPDVAVEMFQMVLDHSNGASTYYIEQAKARLAEINSVTQAASVSVAQTPHVLALSTVALP